MSLPDWIALIAAGAVTVVFVLLGRSVWAFAVGVIAVLVLAVNFSVVEAAGKPARVDLDARIVAAILVYACGLYFFRVFLMRSVSLHFLMRPEDQSAVDEIDQEIARRPHELLRWKLAVERGDKLELTRFGRCVARCVALLG
ncbi:MAG: hypothetical protein ACKVWV_15250 [Planctomycetota bacterium]